MMFVWIIRAVYVMVLAGVAAKITSDSIKLLELTSEGFGWAVLFATILAFGLVPVVLDICYRQKRIATISAVYFGLLVGTLLAQLLSLALNPTLTIWTGNRPEIRAAVTLLATIILCYVCVSVLLQTKSDFRFVIPYVEFARQLKGGRPLILDTSVIIDGRIADIADTGLMDQTLVVPLFILQELQNVADSQDKSRRLRGRRGLDILDRLKRCPAVEVQMHETQGPDGHQRRDIDAQLLELAKSLNGKLVTNDFNLAKMAKIQSIDTININEVSSAAKPPVMHGEQLSVRLVKEGEEPGQGIGYLEDGTMVVAEMGRNFVGTEVNLIVTSVLQTNAGRMVFGKIDSRHPEPARHPPTRR